MFVTLANMSVKHSAFRQEEEPALGFGCIDVGIPSTVYEPKVRDNGLVKLRSGIY